MNRKARAVVFLVAILASVLLIVYFYGCIISGENEFIDPQDSNLTPLTKRYYRQDPNHHNYGPGSRP